MSRQTYSNLIGLLKTKIQGLKYSDLTTIFSSVYDYGESSFAGYPVAVIQEVAGDGSFADTARNERIFEFTITLYQEYGERGKTKKEAADIMRGCVDAVIEALDTDLQLGTSVMKVEVVPVLIDVTIKQGIYKFAEFRIKIVDFVNKF